MDELFPSLRGSVFTDERFSENRYIYIYFRISVARNYDGRTRSETSKFIKVVTVRFNGGKEERENEKRSWRTLKHHRIRYLSRVEEKVTRISLNNQRDSRQGYFQLQVVGVT